MRTSPSFRVDWKFTAPVRPGDTITGAIEVLEVREDKPITKLAMREVYRFL
jgi:acyl dehydratase